jgi:hypothetical protein
VLLAEIRSSSLLTCAIGDQRELADDERGAAGVEQRAVEAALLVLEDPQAGDRPGQPLCVVERVSAADTEQHAKTPADLAARVGVSPSDPLDDRLQPMSMTRAAYCLLPGRSERASL